MGTQRTLPVKPGMAEDRKLSESGAETDDYTDFARQLGSDHKSI